MAKAYLLGVFLSTMVLLSGSAFGQTMDAVIIFGSGTNRLELLSDTYKYGNGASFKTPSFIVSVSPIPTLRLIYVKIQLGENEELDIRLKVDQLSLEGKQTSQKQELKELISRVSEELKPLVERLKENEELSAYGSVLQAVIDGKGILSYKKEEKIVEINRYPEFAFLGSDEIIEVALKGGYLRFVLPRGSAGFSVTYRSERGESFSFEFPERGLGRRAYFLSSDKKALADVEGAVKSLESFLAEALPGILVASSVNPKIVPIHNILSEKFSILHSTKEFRLKPMDGPALEPSQADDSAYEELGTGGYGYILSQKPVFKRIYYFRSKELNGFVFADRDAEHSSVVITINKLYFDPEPSEAEIIPIPQIYFKYLVKEGKAPGSLEVFPRERVPLSKLSSEDAFLYQRAREFFEGLMLDDDAKKRLPEEIRECLSEFIAGRGLPKGDENFKSLLSLSLRESRDDGGSLAMLNYQDDEYHYRISLLPRKDYAGYAFAYGQSLSPLLYRFFLARSGENIQLVGAYPVPLPIGRTNFRFLKSSAKLERLYRICTYFAKLEPRLDDARKLVAEIWGKREFVKPILFMQPLPSPPYIDWVDAQSFP